MQCAGAGQQRAGEGGQPAAHPVARECGAERRPLAAPIEPGMHAECGAEQRRIPVGDPLEVRRRRGDRRLLRLIRHGEPPVETEGVMRRGEDGAAVDQRRAPPEAEADPFDDCREVPGIDRLAVDDRLQADRLEAGAPGPGGAERVGGERRIEARDHAGGAFETAGECDRQAGRGVFRLFVHQERAITARNVTRSSQNRDQAWFASVEQCARRLLRV